VLQGKVGEGAFGLVQKCRSCLDNQTYVIKKTKTSVDGGGSISNLNEATLMMKLKHRNIVKYVDSFVHRDYLYLVMEFCDKGDLE
jgi:serine/threonine protein kinase